MRISHRWRIALISAGAAGLLFGIVLVGAHWAMSRIEREAALETLDEPLRQAAAELSRVEGSREVLEEVGLPEDGSLAVFDGSGRPLVEMGPFKLRAWARDGETEIADARLLYKVRNLGAYRVVAASDWTDASHRLARLRLLFVVLWIPLTLVVGLASFLAAAQMYRPLGKLTHEARIIAEAGKISRLNDPGDPDFSPLARELNAMLERIEEEVHRQERLVADVAHDVRTPLTVIRGRLETALLSGRPEQYGPAIEIAVREAERLGLMADAILRSEGHPQPAELIELEPPLLAAIDRWKPLFERRGVALRAQIETCSAELAPGEWESLLDNLLDNAMKHSPQNTVCDVSLRVSDANVRLGVSDQGPGVPTEDRERIFERFIRLDASRGSKGHGLGLYLCRKIAEARGGRTWVEGVEPNGASFIVELPRAAGLA